MKSFLLSFSICTILFIGQAFSQNANIRGFVYEKATGEPLIFTNVYLKGTNLGVQSDVNGFYSISKIPAGTYTLLVTAVGYDSLQIPITLKENEIVTKKLFVAARSVELGTVDISAERQEAKTDVKMSITKITTREIKQIAGVGGESDIAQYLQTMPGVVSTGDQGGQLYIRGGAPIQNKVLLDGMIIYNPFHSIGFYSVFDADIVRNAEIYTGGFNAEHGGRISSIIDITTRDGNKKRLAGRFSASPFMSKLILEGPLSKAANEDDGSSSFLISARTSYLQQTSPVFYQYVNENAKVPIPYNFTDLYGKVSLNGNNGSKLNLFGFNFRDSVDFANNSNLNWTNNGFGSNFVIIPGAASALINGSVAYSNYKISLKDPGTAPRTSTVNGFNMGLSFTYFFGKDELKYGLDLQAFSTNYTYNTKVGQAVDLPGRSTEIVGYLKYKKVWDKLVIEPGLHLRYYANLAELSPEPRFGAKYNFSEHVRLKLAAGLYSQNLISANSDQEVVNLFYGFLSAPDKLPQTFDGKAVNSKLQKARHFIIGTEFDLAPHLDLNVEAYIKDFYQLININRDKVFDSENDYVFETGLARGIDFSLKYDYKRVYLWAAYSLATVSRDRESNGVIQTYNPNFDRRHNITLVGAYNFGKKTDWDLNVRWNIGSGFPFTQTQGFYEKQDFGQGAQTPYGTSPGGLGIIYAGLNQGRLPWYHRFDITIKKRWELGKNSTLEANVSATNVYNRNNVFYVDRITAKRVDQLPFLPSAGFNITF